MHTEDAYAELGLARGASDAELKAAWRRLVALWHPDRNPRPDAAQRMQRINRAYGALREARSDDEGAGSAGGATTDAATAADAGAATQDASSPGRAQGAPPETGSPRGATETRTVRRKLRLRLEEAALGCTRVVSGRLNLACGDCAGQGLRLLDADCPACRGQGQVRRGSLFNWLASTTEPCADCGGQGRARESCAGCAGRGRRSASYRRSVRLPAGARAGDVLTAPGGRHGGVELTLELQLEIEAHPFFTLDDNADLRCTVPVDGFAWVAERAVDVPTPAGLQPLPLRRDQRHYRLPGAGFPAQRRGEPGDLLVEVQPCYPDTFSPAQLALLERLLAESAAPGAVPPALARWRRQLQDWAARGDAPPPSGGP
jgi:molecular chaperone DnaJ